MSSNPTEGAEIMASNAAANEYFTKINFPDLPAPKSALSYAVYEALLQAGYTMDSHRTADGMLNVSARKGNRLVTVTPNAADGTCRVAMFIDYGDDGKNWCDGATLRSAAAVVRRAKGFLR